MVSVIAVGGMIGATARYAIGETWPTSAAGFPWSTFTINLTGCFALGVLMTCMTDRGRPNRLIRPFLGTGVICGYTTFSTYAVETNDLLTQHPALGLAYLTVSVLLGLAALIGGRAVTKAIGWVLDKAGGQR